MHNLDCNSALMTKASCPSALQLLFVIYSALLVSDFTDAVFVAMYNVRSLVHYVTRRNKWDLKVGEKKKN